MRIPFILLAGSVLASCATAPPAPDARAEQEFRELIAGKVAGEPITCLPSWKSRDMVTIGDSVIAFRDGRTVYVNNVVSGCDTYGGNYALVTRTTGSGLCRGDIVHVTDLTNGMTVGSCSLGDFVPYKTPG